MIINPKTVNETRLEITRNDLRSARLISDHGPSIMALAIASSRSEVTRCHPESAGREEEWLAERRRQSLMFW